MFERLSSRMRLLPRITRDTVIQLAADLQVDCHRIDISREEL